MLGIAGRELLSRLIERFSKAKGDPQPLRLTALAAVRLLQPPSTIINRLVDFSLSGQALESTAQRPGRQLAKTRIGRIDLQKISITGERLVALARLLVAAAFVEPTVEADWLDPVIDEQLLEGLGCGCERLLPRLGARIIRLGRLKQHASHQGSRLLGS